MKRLCMLFIVAMLGIAVSGCGSDDEGTTAASGNGETTEASGEPIVLGFAIGETGFMEPYDVSALTAAELAVEDINAEGGVNGRQLEIITEDTKSEPEQGGNAATKLIDEGADVIVTSCDFDQGSPAAIVAQQEGLLAFSTCAASTSFGPEGIGPLAFTMATAAPVEGATMAEWAFNEKGWTKAFSLHDDTIEFTKQTTAGFEERFEELGGELVGKATFKQGDQSIASQINEIKSSDAEFIWFTSYNPTMSAAIKQIRSAGVDLPILGDEDLDGDYWREAVPNLTNVFYTTYGSIYGDDSNPAINEIVERYEETTGSPPDTSLFLTGYATVEAIAEAIRRAGTTEGAALQAELEQFSNEDFLLPTTFTPEQHISFARTLRIMEIDGDETRLVTEFAPESVPLP